MGILSLKKHPPQVSIFFPLSSLKYVMCLEVKKIFERIKVNEGSLNIYDISLCNN